MYSGLHYSVIMVAALNLNKDMQTTSLEQTLYLQWGSRK